MKIKSVCQVTGLSDRTIRYYIEQELIFPSFTENYIGRKTFDFSQEDIEKLKNIATLRKFDFTIEEIRGILSDTKSSIAVIENVKARTEKEVKEGKKKLSALSQLDMSREYTLAQLAQKLDEFSFDTPVVAEKVNKSFWKTLLSIIGSVVTFILVWLPVAVAVFFFDSSYEYPLFNKNPLVYIILALSFLPSAGVLVLSKFSFSKKKRVKVILLVLCFLSIPWSFVSSISIFSCSETTDIRYYREFDAECTFDQWEDFNDLFPESPRYFENVEGDDGHYHTVYLDSQYYYRYYSGFDTYTYNVYAEWPLEKADFDQEVKRVSEVFSKYEQNSTWEGYVELEKGDYTCLIAYDPRGFAPFEEVKCEDRGYFYKLFAYNEKDLRVRYFYGSCFDWADEQPYYMTREW